MNNNNNATINNNYNQNDEVKKNKRGLVIKEIVTTEIQYVRRLEWLINHVYQPFYSHINDDEITESNRFIDKERFKYIFSDISIIYQLSNHILSKLLERVVEIENITHETSIVDILYNYKEFFKFYIGYCSNYQTAIVKLQELKSTNRKFKTKLESIFSQESDDNYNLQLESYLVMPVGRVPRYLLLYQELLKFSDSSYSDYTLLVNLIESTKATISTIQRRVEFKSMESLLYHENDFTLPESAESITHLLYKPYRQFIAHSKFVDSVFTGDNNELISEGTTTYILFKDMIIRAEEQEQLQQSINGFVAKLLLKEIIYIRDILSCHLLNNNDNNDNNNNDDESYSDIILTVGHKKYQLRSAILYKRVSNQGWLDMINECRNSNL